MDRIVEAALERGAGGVRQRCSESWARHHEQGHDKRIFHRTVQAYAPCPLAGVATRDRRAPGAIKLLVCEGRPKDGDAQTQAKGKLDQVFGAAHQAYGQLKDGVRDAFENTLEAARERIHERLDDLEGRVIAKPLPALAIAGAIGVVIGLLLLGRRKTIYRCDSRWQARIACLTAATR